MSSRWTRANTADASAANCGPVGLAMIAILASRGIATIIASDPSPGRRALARSCGAHLVVDPSEHLPFTAVAGHGERTTMPDEINAGIDALEGLARLPPAVGYRLANSGRRRRYQKPKRRSSSSASASPE